MLNFSIFEIALLALCAVLTAVLVAIMWWRIAGERVKALWRGWLALPLLWKSQKGGKRELLANLRKAHRALAAVIEPKVYQYGFLRRIRLS